MHIALGRGRLLVTMTQNDLFSSGNQYADQVLSFLCYGDDSNRLPKASRARQRQDLNRRVVIQTRHVTANLGSYLVLLWGWGLSNVFECALRRHLRIQPVALDHS